MENKRSNRAYTDSPILHSLKLMDGEFRAPEMARIKRAMADRNSMCDFSSDFECHLTDDRPTNYPAS